MDTGRSFKGYEKVSEIAGRQFRRTTQRRLVLIASAAVVLLVTIIAVGVATSSGRPPSPTSVSDSIKAVCRVTPYPNSCFSSISSARDSSVTAEIFKLSLSLSPSPSTPSRRRSVTARSCSTARSTGSTTRSR
ncbi:unnamed protein product [Musa acuminata var. zebrina]